MYELLYIVGTQYTDPEIEKIQQQIATEVETAGGVIVRNENLGKIRLAFPIKKQRHGSYILVYFNAEPSVVNALNRKLSLTDELLRHTLTTRPAGVETLKVELSSYVAPLSEEARKQKYEGREGHDESERPARRKIEELPVSTFTMTPPSIPSSTSAIESTMSIEELDKKLDELLEEDITKDV